MRKPGNALLLLGILLVLAAGGLCISNWVEDWRASVSAQAVLNHLEAYLDSQAEPPAPSTPSSEASDPEIPEETVLLPLETEPIDPTMTEVEFQGNRYIGYLTIPGLDTALPVMSDWDYAKLQIAPCRFHGSTKTDDLVLMAHNYDVHFGRLNGLKSGDQVSFTDMDGETILYQVVATEILNPYAVEDMNSAAYDLTLFTCTYGGKSRVTVRCDRVSQ